MSRGNWRILAAIGGLALLAAKPGGEGQPQQQQIAKAEIASTGKPAALHEPDPTPASEKPCAKGQHDHASDLCAQWKAADAASSAADAAWLFGYAGATIGLMTLLAAAAAAIYARSASIHTETSAKSFIETERAILHAIGGDVGEINTDKRECVVIEIINRGRASGKIVEIGAYPRSGSIEDNRSLRWLVVPPDQRVMVPGFAPPGKNETLVVDCWIKYRTIGPDAHTSHFTVTVYWWNPRSETIISIPGWMVEVTNPNGHPDDT